MINKSVIMWVGLQQYAQPIYKYQVNVKVKQTTLWINQGQFKIVSYQLVSLVSGLLLLLTKRNDLDLER